MRCADKSSFFRSFLSGHRPPARLRPFPRPLQALDGSGTVTNAARFTVALPLTAVWPAHASHALLPHWLCDPAHGAFRQCGWSRCCEGHGLDVSGGNQWLAGPETMDVGELLSYQVGGTRWLGDSTLTRARVTSRSARVLSPQSRARVP